VGTVDVRVEIDEGGQARSATATARLDYPIERIWRIVEDVGRYPGRIPMINRIELDGDRATVQLKFKIALFSVKFEFVVSVSKEAKDSERWLELRWVAGEPRGIKLRFDLEPLDGGAATLLRSTGAFDVTSLGWLAKYFLKGHPEIQFGVIPGVAVGLLEAMRLAARDP
jgi:hypothetical protein